MTSFVMAQCSVVALTVAEPLPRVGVPRISLPIYPFEWTERFRHVAAKKREPGNEFAIRHLGFESVI